jgi:thiosulfate/3-mercaptopyruvate sulfurtransferase
MRREILFSPADLRSARQEHGCVTVDCRFNLKNTEAGFEKYLQAHIPGAVYAHLDDDLSSAVTQTSGRHPLPDPDVFASFLARSGWRPGKLLVAYDDAGGAIAARLWWLMKYFGHDCAALLGGGMRAWCEAGFGLESDNADIAAMPAECLSANKGLVYSTANVLEGLDSGRIVLVDARASKRFAGKVEPIDTVAGHVPGSINYPLTLNLLADGNFKPVEDIHRGLQELIVEHETRDLVHMCGSGVTACLNLFAAELAGIRNGKLYVGSWSEWIRDPSRPVEP